MKKHLAIISTIFISITALTFYSCDEFNTLPLNIPFVVDFSASGASLQDTGTLCVGESETYQDYRDKIKEIKLLKITYRTKSVSPVDITCNIRIIVKRQDNGATLFNQVISNVKPKNYLPPNPPYVFTLSQTELQLFDDYLRLLGDPCFEVTFQAENVTGGNPPYSIEGASDILFEAITEL
ncbi:MAG: hypothetical protein HXY49_07475 [Ignavibacteriaceae bacterium]|nr:hypothetical protein [Ignavibacteriaceae bacterium]